MQNLNKAQQEKTENCLKALVIALDEGVELGTMLGAIAERVEEENRADGFEMRVADELTVLAAKARKWKLLEQGKA